MEKGSPRGRVDIRRDGKRFPVSTAWAKKVVGRTLAFEKRGHYSVGILLTDDGRIRRIHKKFLLLDRPTDVLSFPLTEGRGDIVVSAQTAARKAGELGVTFKEELARYLVHGTLHLLGYDDRTRPGRAKMWRRQELILRKILKR